MKPFISSYAYIPYDMLGEHKSRFSSDTRVNIKNALTHVPTKFMEDGKDTRITAYDDTSYSTHLGVPLEWALKPGRYDLLDWEDRTCMGTMRLKAKKEIDPYHEQAPEGQAEFIQGILKVLEERVSCLATADTGAGKTPTGLAIASRIGLRTLIVVDQINLADQWKQEAINLLGMNPNHVAIVQGKGGFNMTAPICIATIQSIRKGTALYPKKFYESFGFWIFDEVHIMGAATFSEAFKYCYGAFRLGLTATDERKDGSDKVYKWFLGQPRVKAEGKSMNLKAFVHNYSNGGKYPFGNNLSIHISHLSKDKNRNKFITGLVLEAYNRDRHILVIGDRIPQLEDIKERLINLGVSSKDVGLYTGSATQANGKRKILKEKDVKSILKDCRIVLATYKKAEKGLNVPRLDWGIDITPRGKGVQVTGRIRRLMKGKPLPEWHTIRDQEYAAFCGMCNSRVWEYKKKGFDVEFIG